MKMKRFFKQFNWRFLLVRILVNAIALALTALVVPKIYFVDKSISNWLLMAITLGVLNALIKPVLQIFTMQFLFVTFGLVIVIVNTLILWLLSFIFPARFAVDNLFWAFVGGLVLGLFSSFFESLLGLTMPIVPDEPPQLRHQLEEQARHVEWLTAPRSDLPAMGRPLVTEAPIPEPNATEPAVAELPTAGPDGEPSPQVEVETERLDAAAMLPVEDPGVENPVPAPEPEEEQKEDGS